MQAVSFKKIDLTDGFWREKQTLIGKVTLRSIYQQFVDTHRFDAFAHQWNEKMDWRPHPYWDSDVAKVMEAACYLLGKNQGEAWMAQLCVQIMDTFEAHQWPDGYFNSYYTLTDPAHRFTNRNDHELYCLGHWIEAAVAYEQIAGDKRMICLVDRYIDLVIRVFQNEHSAGFLTPGHEEIELALLRLYECTGKEKYLDLAAYFVDTRGSGAEPNTSPRRTAFFCQADEPLRMQRQAKGHSVRAAYIYTAMADLARIRTDGALQQACEAIFDNIVNRRMYLTGGIGQTQQGESFTIDYDLENAGAYTETCAAIGFALFLRRMTRLQPRGIYADTAERCFYNGILSGISLDGAHFFYENPLELHPKLQGRYLSVTAPPRQPKTVRQAVFPTSCCPPNIARMIASIGDWLYTHDERTLYVHHYMASEAAFDGMRICQKTQYPFDGAIELCVAGAAELALRIPGWCDAFSIVQNGERVKCAPADGYVRLALDAGENQIILNLQMVPRWTQCNPSVCDSAMKAALEYGPFVYCAEGVDNGENLSAVRVLPDAPIQMEKNACCGLPAITVQAQRQKTFDGLYRRFPMAVEPCTIRMIPYYQFANRGETEMMVWFKT